MAGPKIEIILVIAVLVVYQCSGAYQAYGPHTDIKKFLNTTDVIWTYNTTAGPTLKCRVDNKLFMNDSQIVFQRSHRLQNGNWTHRNLRGNFTHWLFSQRNQTYNAMLVSRFEHPMANWSTEELLVHQDANNQCGVFKIVRRKLGLDLITVELRIRNSSVHEGPSENCTNVYRRSKRMKQKSYGLYTSDCQKAVEDHQYEFLLNRQ
ncbi:uncharacterized protein LOC142587000 [Dermacentor variabilis]|uniref:uncharacterized protein LOC142587000 n=1 Tax=Dermacentor variabilis TaxID=34621 RepID=UPI003F5B9456